MAIGRSIIQLHEFGDASPKAYGAAVYIRSMDATSKVSTHYLCPDQELRLQKLSRLQD